MHQTLLSVLMSSNSLDCSYGKVWSSENIISSNDISKFSMLNFKINHCYINHFDSVSTHIL